MGLKAKRYTEKEEFLHSLTHGIGAVLGIVGTILLIVRSVRLRSVLSVVASSIYGASLILLYTMSACYHAAKNDKTKKILRVLDHSSIFLLIAGSYTPYTLITLRDSSKGMLIFAVVWVVAVLGIILNAINVEKFGRLSLVLYLIMGWAVVFDWRGISTGLLPQGLWLLIGGGLFYTVGILFYVQKKKEYMHVIWHVFVLLGSALHFFSVYLYVIPTL